MNLDQFILKFDKTLLYPLKYDNFHRMLYGLSQCNIGYFEWEYENDKIELNDVLANIFSIDWTKDVHFLTLLQEKVDRTAQFKFYRSLIELLKYHRSKTLELQVTLGKSPRWFKLSLSINEHDQYVIGIVEDITSLKEAEKLASGISAQLDQLLDILPLPVYYYDTLGNILYTNQYESRILTKLNKLIEQHINGYPVSVQTTKWLKNFEVGTFSKHHMKFKIQFLDKGKVKSYVVHRVEVYDDNDCIGLMYIHEDISIFTSSEIHLNKILKVNQLIIELRDIVDHANDLKSMYDYLLSRVHTVIPGANRACILKIDNKDEMYIDSGYGFDDIYLSNMRLPYKESYAYMAMKNDYSRSVIINDIQENFSDIHPEINKNQHGFVLRSNLTTPLIVDNQLYGILSVDSCENKVFDDVDLNLLDFMKIQIERAIIKFKKLKKVEENSVMDPLTGIYNRRYLYDNFDHVLQDAKEKALGLTCVVFDLDKLKYVNDNFGHVAGDKILKQFAFLISKEIRPSDIFTRIGGDEFVGIFINMTMDTLKQRVDRWQKILEAHPITSEGHQLTGEFSYGVSELYKDGESLSELLNIADKRMYKHKRNKDA